MSLLGQWSGYPGHGYEFDAWVANQAANDPSDPLGGTWPSGPAPTPVPPLPAPAPANEAIMSGWEPTVTYAPTTASSSDWSLGSAINAVTNATGNIFGGLVAYEKQKTAYEQAKKGIYPAQPGIDTKTLAIAGGVAILAVLALKS